MDSAMTSTPTIDLQRAELAAFLAEQPDIDVMRHFLGFSLLGAPLSLNQAVIVCLNLEWWEKPPHPTTEIGIAELSPLGLFPNTHAENILTEIRVAHARIKPHAHLLNKFKGAGNPENFDFGTTKFVTPDEAKQVLLNTFLRPRADDARYLQPIIVLAHDTEHKFAHVSEKFALDILGLGTIVKVLDTQTLARQAGILGPKGPIISLPHLVEHFNIRAANLHTAGNDAGYTLMTAILASLKNDMYGHLPLAQAFAKPPAEAQGRNIQDVVGNVMAVNKGLAPPPWGVQLFCTRCNRLNHLRAQCVAKVQCTLCAASTNPKLKKAARTHMEEKCVILGQWGAGAAQQVGDGAEGSQNTVSNG